MLCQLLPFWWPMFWFRLSPSVTTTVNAMPPCLQPSSRIIYPLACQSLALGLCFSEAFHIPIMEATLLCKAIQALLALSFSHPPPWWLPPGRAALRTCFSLFLSPNPTLTGLGLVFSTLTVPWTCLVCTLVLLFPGQNVPLSVFPM